MDQTSLLCMYGTIHLAKGLPREFSLTPSGRHQETVSTCGRGVRRYVSCKGEPFTVPYASSRHAGRVVSGVSDGRAYGGGDVVWQSSRQASLREGHALHCHAPQPERVRSTWLRPRDMPSSPRQVRATAGGKQARVVDRSPAGRVTSPMGWQATDAGTT